MFQVVEPFFQSGMFWETWQHGPGPLPQYCPAPDAHQPFSFTIAAVAVPDGAGWYVNQDHSKWGVTSSQVPSCCQRQVHHQQWQCGQSDDGQKKFILRLDCLNSAKNAVLA